jgi:hypothetical protein
MHSLRHTILEMNFIVKTSDLYSVINTYDIISLITY